MALVLGVFSALTLYISYKDIRSHKISDQVNALALTIVAVLSIYLLIIQWNHVIILIAWLVGLAIFLMFYLLAVISGGSIGGGDVKFAPSLSISLALFDPWWGFLAPFAAFQLAGLMALVLILFKKRSLMQSIAFAPFLTAGFHLVLISKLVVA